MFEQFWAAFLHRKIKPDGGPSLREKAMRAFYLEQGRSDGVRPASKAIWQSMIARIKRQRD